MFTGRTPESLIPRSDSRNPATTCKGITKSGRPCRRAIDAKDTNHDGGVLAVASVVSDDDEEETGAAAFFCWQHKDQAEHLMAANAPGASAQDTQLYPLQERDSIDTLVARLGVLDVGEPEQAPAPQRRRKQNKPDASGRPPRKINRPPTWDQVQGPLLSVPSDIMAERRKRPAYRPESRPPPRKHSFWASLCCGSSSSDDRIARHKRPHAPPPPMAEAPRPSTSKPRPRPASNTVPAPAPAPSTPPRKPVPSKQPNSPTQLIPPSLPQHTSTALAAELAKPISQKDEEGYIYIFWLTPEAAGPAPARTASDLLVPPSRHGRGRATSDVLRQYSVRRGRAVSGAGAGVGAGTARASGSATDDGSATKDTEKNTILLKIGRANNVTRRMHEWTRQCGYDLSLVRYYPYVPATATPSPSPLASPAPSPKASPRPSPGASPQASANEVHRKVPFVHRVERLIHIELAEKRVIKKCEACGKEHREWFEVEATREGVKDVDGVVRRWVGWAEGRALEGE